MTPGCLSPAIFVISGNRLRVCILGVQRGWSQLHRGSCCIFLHNEVISQLIVQVWVEPNIWLGSLARMRVRIGPTHSVDVEAAKTEKQFVDGEATEDDLLGEWACFEPFEIRFESSRTQDRRRTRIAPHPSSTRSGDKSDLSDKIARIGPDLTGFSSRRDTKGFPLRA